MQSVRILCRNSARLVARSSAFKPRTICAQGLSKPLLISCAYNASTTKHFSSSTIRSAASSEELVQKLESELAYEKEALVEQGENGEIKEYLDSSEFTLQDPAGSDEVHLVRKYGDEEIKVIFSTSSMANADPEADYNTDPALADEDGTGRNQDAQNKDPDSEEYGDQTPYQVQVSIQVSREGKGAMVLTCVVDQDAQFVIEDIAHFASKEIAEGSTPQAELARRDIYTGPSFAELDENLQTLFDQYLKDRGINESMALFIPNYIEQKETQEYMRWMSNIKKFVE